MAATAWEISRQTLAKRLAAADIAAKNGKFTTLQICAAIYSDQEAERTGLIRAQRIKTEAENKKTSREWVAVSEVSESLSRAASAIRQIIVLSPLPDHEKNAVLLEIQRIAATDFTKKQVEDDDEPAE